MGPMAGVDSFLESNTSGVLLDSNRLGEKTPKAKNVFFSPVGRLSERQKEFIENVSEEYKLLNFGIDPFSLSLWKSEIHAFENPLKGSAKLPAGCVQWFKLSSLAYRNTGASHVQELAILMSSVVEVFRELSGVQSDKEVSESLSLEMSLDTHLFLNIAKLQAMPILLRLVYQSLKIEETEIPIFATPSWRYLASREPWNNILRMTTMCMAAQFGGAQGFLNLPHDFFSKIHREKGRVSRNIQEILDREANLSQLEFPGDGSYFIDSLTRSLCEKAWHFFQEIEKKGGLLKSMLSGWLQREINSAGEIQIEEFISRREKMIGVNSFVLGKSLSIDYPLLKREDIETIGEKMDSLRWR